MAPAARPNRRGEHILGPVFESVPLDFSVNPFSPGRTVDMAPD